MDLKTALDEAAYSMTQGEWVKAKSSYEAIVTGYPDCAPAWHMLGFLAAQQKDFKGAEHCLQKAIELDPEVAIYQTHLGNVFRQGGCLNKALDAYQKSIQLDPCLPQAHNNLGNVHFQSKDFEKAKACYDAALKLDGEYLDAQCNMAMVASAEGDEATAEHWYELVLEKCPNHGPALHGLMRIYVNQGELKQAASFAQKIIDEQEEDVEACHVLAAQGVARDQLRTARFYYETIVRLNPEDALAHYNLGVLFYADEKWEKALDHYQKAHHLDPKNVDTLHNLGATLLKMKREEDAKKAFSRALDIDRNHTMIQYMMTALTGKGNVPDQAPKDYVAQLFDGYASSFDSALKVLDYQVPKQIGKTIEAFFKSRQGDGELSQPKLTICDLGCGTGLCGEGVKPFASRLVGIDLSTEMLLRAKTKGVYDALVESDITGFFQNQQEKFDLIMAGDVLVYLGDLEKLFSEVKSALHPGGVFIFTIEKSHKKPYRLCNTGRYAHHEAYIKKLGKQWGFQLPLWCDGCQPMTLRRQQDDPVEGMLWVLESRG